MCAGHRNARTDVDRCTPSATHSAQTHARTTVVDVAPRNNPRSWLLPGAPTVFPTHGSANVHHRNRPLAAKLLPGLQPRIQAQQGARRDRRLSSTPQIFFFFFSVLVHGVEAHRCTKDGTATTTTFARAAPTPTNARRARLVVVALLAVVVVVVYTRCAGFGGPSCHTSSLRLLARPLTSPVKNEPKKEKEK